MLGIYHEVKRGSPGVVCAMKKKYGEHRKEDQSTPIRQ